MFALKKCLNFNNFHEKEAHMSNGRNHTDCIFLFLKSIVFFLIGLLFVDQQFFDENYLSKTSRTVQM